MELYVGMDVSLKETSICVVDGSGRIVSEGTVISEPSAIAEFVQAKAVSAVRIALETGPRPRPGFGASCAALACQGTASMPVLPIADA